MNPTMETFAKTGHECLGIIGLCHVGLREVPWEQPIPHDSARPFYAGAATLLPQPQLIMFGSRPFHGIVGQVRTVVEACIEWLAIPILSIAIFAVLMIAEVRGRRWAGIITKGQCAPVLGGRD
jgi:hypothetical protein